jgi:hypothetical protein
LEYDLALNPSPGGEGLKEQIVKSKTTNMKMKLTLLMALQFIYVVGSSQYIGVRARYTETRLVDNSPLPKSRENRLVLSFFEVSADGVYTPANLSNYELWIYKEGFQYGSFTGGVTDSSGNNYPGYAWTAPATVAYYNSYGPNYIDCYSNVTTLYSVNGSHLDCGWVRVSHWEEDISNGQLYEVFTAPNVCLPYYLFPDQYFLLPGNVNFRFPVPAGPPDNWYSFSCGSSAQQLVIRGVLPQDTSLVTLPVHFANERISINASGIVTINWSNLNESDISHYEIERADTGNIFRKIGEVMPSMNNGNQADYEYSDHQIYLREKILYRIRAVELNGNSFYSAVLMIRNTKENLRLTVYPNPVLNGRFDFQVDELARGRYTLELISINGQRRLIKEIIHNGGPVTQVVQLPYMAGGIYSFVFRSNEVLLTSKLIIGN